MVVALAGAVVGLFYLGILVSAIAVVGIGCYSKQASLEDERVVDVGRKLEVLGRLGLPSATDVTLVDSLLFTIGNGSLTIAEVSGREIPEIIGSISGFGNTRQLAVSAGVAYVASREDGLFLVAHL